MIIALVHSTCRGIVSPVLSLRGHQLEIVRGVMATITTNNSDSTHHKDGAIPSTCRICGTSFTSRGKLFKHIRNDHSLTGDVSEKPADFTSKSVETPDIAIVAEDDFFRVINKPQGLSTMGAKGETLVNTDKMLLANAIELKLSYKKAVPCHRLDKDTGGLVICSKHYTAEKTIKEFFYRKLIGKKYLAVVAGRIDPPVGTISSLMGGKECISKYNVLQCTKSHQYGEVSTVELWPVTGRRHQLRRHMKLVGHPIIGDRRYSHADSWPDKADGGSLFLFAVSLRFPSPRQYFEEGISEKVAEYMKSNANHVQEQQQQQQQQQSSEQGAKISSGKVSVETAVADVHQATTKALTSVKRKIDDNDGSSPTVAVAAATAAAADGSADNVNTNGATSDNRSNDRKDDDDDESPTTCTEEIEYTHKLCADHQIEYISVEIGEPAFYAEFRQRHAYNYDMLSLHNQQHQHPL